MRKEDFIKLNEGMEQAALHIEKLFGRKPIAQIIGSVVVMKEFIKCIEKGIFEYASNAAQREDLQDVFQYTAKLANKRFSHIFVIGDKIKLYGGKENE